MNIFSYFRKKGIDTLDPTFYRKIEEWKSWYHGNVRGFSFYRIYTGQGTCAKRKRNSLGMAKKVCEDIADLLLNERVRIAISHDQTAAFVNEVLERNHFLVLGNDYQERKACTGTVAYVPYLYDIEMADDGTVLDAKIGIDYASAQNIYPVSWNNGRVTECVFIFPKTLNRKKYIQIQHHKLVDGQYVIENTVIEAVPGSKEGKELSETEWKTLKPFSKIEARVETGSSEPQYVLDRLNIVNNADDDESNPMGVAIFANAIDILKGLDMTYDSYCNEFEFGRKRVFVAPEMMKNKDGSLAFDPEDTVFYKMPEDYNEKSKEGMIHEMNMAIRAEQHSKGINDGLNYLSLKCGFGTERYKFDGSGVKTATEVISENSDMYRMLKKHEIILNDAIIELVQIIIRLGIAIGKPLQQDTKISIDFDDSIIEDKQAERQQDRQDVSMGVMPLWEYRAKWYNETPEKAKVAIPQAAEVIE